MRKTEVKMALRCLLIDLILLVYRNSGKVYEAKGFTLFRWQLRCRSSPKPVCLSLLFPKIRINEWSEGKIFNVNMTKVLAWSLRSIRKNQPVNRVEGTWSVKRRRKAITIFMALLWASVLKSPELEFSCAFLMCLFKEKNKRSS